MNEHEKRARKLFKVDRELPKVEMQLPFGDVEMIDLDSMREILRFICHMEGIGATEQDLDTMLGGSLLSVLKPEGNA